MRKNFLNIYADFIQRKRRVEYYYSIVGLEIKDRRLKVSKTLESLAHNICSTSYMSKIENGKIRPNRVVMREICRKLNIDEEKIDYLLAITQKLKRVVLAFAHGEHDVVSKIYQEGLGFINYRFKIIELIYLIDNKKYGEASSLCDEIGKLIANMNEYDFTVYSIFYGILCYYTENYIEGKTIFEKMNFDFKDEGLNILKFKYEFYCSFKLNDRNTLLLYRNLRDYLVDIGCFTELEENNYIIGIYLLRNNCLCEYIPIYKSIRNSTYKKNLSLYSKLLLNKNMKIKSQWYEGTSPYFYNLAMIRNNNFDKLLNLSHKDSIGIIEYNYLIINYLMIPSSTERYNYILYACKEELKKTHEMYLFKFFLDELSKMSIELSRYKDFVMMYRMFDEECIWKK